MFDHRFHNTATRLCLGGGIARDAASVTLLTSHSIKER
jgi:hypothetical protein